VPIKRKEINSIKINCKISLKKAGTAQDISQGKLARIEGNKIKIKFPARGKGWSGLGTSFSYFPNKRMQHLLKLQMTCCFSPQRPGPLMDGQPSIRIPP